ncbi:MAG: rubrerythrin family protein, partial [Candidatus Woesearchaeota archaeon]
MAEKLLLQAQKNEITEYYLYRALAQQEKNTANKKTLLKLANDELRHYQLLVKQTKKECKPNYAKVLWYRILASLFGITFAIRLMEQGESHAQQFYAKQTGLVLKKLLREE